MASSDAPAVARWSGHAWVGPGIGIFLGHAAHQDRHHHQAHQIALGIDAALTVETPQGRLSGMAIFIPAGLQHRLTAGRVLSIYLDTLSDEARALPVTEAAQPMEIAPSKVAAMTEALNGPGMPHAQMRARVRQMLQLAEPPAADPRVARIIAALQEGHRGRETLAALAHLSPTRFSHWFVEQTGVPLRSYVKWLRLTQSLQHLARGGRLTEAAHAAGFADSAHFSRTFRTLLGLDPSSALAEVGLQAS
jgi:AraC-like DNA-binding protein